MKTMAEGYVPSAASMAPIAARNEVRRWRGCVVDPQDTAFGVVPTRVFQDMESLCVGEDAPLVLSEQYREALSEMGIVGV